MRTATLDGPTTRVSAARTAPTSGGDGWWPWAMAAAAYVLYLAVAWHLMHGVGFEIGDAISRTGAAHHVVRSRDPHLAAMGFYWMPLPTLSQIPMVLLLSPFGHAQFAGPASSGLWGALTIPVLAAIGRRNAAPARVTQALCGLYAVSPIAVWVGANGMSEASSFFFSAVVLLGYSGWWRDRRPADLALTSFGLAGLMACRYEAVLVTAAVAGACALLVPRPLWTRTIALVSLPAAYVFLLWLFASRLIVGNAFYWFEELNRIAAVSGTGAAFYKADGGAPRHVVAFVIGFVALFAALLFVLVPLAVRRDAPGRLGRLGLLVPALVFPANMTVQLLRESAPAAARYFYPVWIASLGAALALAGETPVRARWARWRPRALLAGAALTAVVQLFAFADPNVSGVENEGVLFAPLVGREPPAPPDGATWDARFRPWQELFAVADPLLADGARLLLDTDTAPHATLFSRQPRQLVIPEDRDFEQILAAPDGRVDLVALPSSAGPRGSRYYASLEAVVRRTSSRGRWVVVDEFDTLTLYRFVPS